MKKQSQVDYVVGAMSRQCLGKKRMLEKHADLVIMRAESEGAYLRKYYCHMCGGWHVTSKPIKKK